MTKVKERTMHIVFLVAACMSILAVDMICLFKFANGVPAIRQIGFVNFIFGKTWMPGANKFGIFPMIIGSIYVTAGAIIIGVPIGLLCAVFMAKFCPPKLHKIMKPAVDLLAGIPSIVYGFFGLVVITPMIRNTFGGSGKNILTACILLGIMILPTIISVSESAIARFRKAITKEHWHSVIRMREVSSRQYSLQQNPESLQPLFLESGVRSVRQWQSS